MIFTFENYKRAVSELEESKLENKKFILYCLRNYCPLVTYGVSEPSLGQVLASAHEAWRASQAARGVAEEPLPIPPGLDDV
jgi:hypothetical protein